MSYTLLLKHGWTFEAQPDFAAPHHLAPGHRDHITLAELPDNVRVEYRGLPVHHLLEQDVLPGEVYSGPETQMWDTV